MRWPFGDKPHLDFAGVRRIRVVLPAPVEVPGLVQGLENYQELIGTLTNGKGVIKAFCEIAPLDTPVGMAIAGNKVVHGR